MRTRSVIHSAVIAACLLAACGSPGDAGVRTGTAVQRPAAGGAPTTDSTTAPATDPPGTTAPTDSTTTAGSDTPTSDAAVPVEPPPVDTGPDKQPQPYDDDIPLLLGDILGFWTNEFPSLFGEEFTPISGGIYAAYPGRNDLPGCGQPSTDYDTHVRGNAFYCIPDDFLVYDDDALFPQVYDQLGVVGIGVILAHEIGHAVQARAGVPASSATIVLEQQADCFAGAWAAHAQGSSSSGVSFDESDLRSALLALMAFKDPIGANPAAAGAHGSGFDRVGAFQDGFVNRADACVGYVDDLPPILELPADASFLQNSGNAPLDDLGDPDVPDPQDPSRPTGIYGLLITDLPEFWQGALDGEGVTFTAPPVVGYDGPDDAPACTDEPVSDRTAFVFCPDDGSVHIDTARGADLYDQYGDFAVGYVVTTAYGEAVQAALGSDLTGAERALADDCLSGAYTQSTIPSGDQSGRVSVQAGDLDEAVEAAITLGDPSGSDDVAGTAFDKVAAFRSGILGGLDACLDRIGDS